VRKVTRFKTVSASLCEIERSTSRTLPIVRIHPMWSQGFSRARARNKLFHNRGPGMHRRAEPLCALG
jgi:hypothetical protein